MGSRQRACFIVIWGFWLTVVRSIYQHPQLQRLIVNIDEIVNTAVVDHDRSPMELRLTSSFSVLPLLMSRAVGGLQPVNAAMYPGISVAFNHLHLLADGQVNINEIMDSGVPAILHLIPMLLHRILVIGQLRQVIHLVGIPLTILPRTTNPMVATVHLRRRRRP